MAVIQSGASFDQWTIDPTSKAGRVTLYDSAGNELHPFTTTTTLALSPVNVQSGATSDKWTIDPTSKAGRITIYDSAGNEATQPQGSQGSTYVSVQTAFDAVRLGKILEAKFITPATVDTLVSCTYYEEGSSTGTGTSFAVGTSRRLRIQAFTLTVNDVATTAQGCAAFLLVSGSGAVTTTSAHAAAIGCYVPATAVVQQASSASVSFPDGLEISGSQQFGISARGLTTATEVTITVVGFEY